MRRKTCCCEIALRAGCKIWAILYLCGNILILAGAGYTTANLDKLQIPGGLYDVEDVLDKEEALTTLLETLKKWVLVLEIVIIAYAAIDFLFNLLLLYSVNKRNLLCCKIWVWFNMAKVLLSGVLVLVYLCFLGVTFSIPVGFLIGYGLVCGFGFILPIYVIVVVRRYVEEMQVNQQGFVGPILVHTIAR